MAYTAYFDESGIHSGSEITVIAGFLGDEDAWQRLDDGWRMKLDEFELSWFHAVDCEHGNGEFLGKHPEPIRKFILMEFARVIASARLTIVASAFVVDDWRDVATVHLKARFPSAYMFCFEFCMQKLSSWAKADPIRGKVDVVFARQTEFQSQALEMFGHYSRNGFFGDWLGAAEYREMPGSPGLQAADLLCSETYRRGRAGPTAPVTRAMECLLRSSPSPVFGFFDKESFRMLIQNGPAGRLY